MLGQVYTSIEELKIQN